MKREIAHPCSIADREYVLKAACRPPGIGESMASGDCTRSSIKDHSDPLLTFLKAEQMLLLSLSLLRILIPTLE